MANSFLTGLIAPTNEIGDVTDYYRNSVTNVVYYKENSTTWVLVPALTPTPDGVGTTWLHGTGAPSNAIGSPDDYYNDDDSKVIYRKDNNNEWQPNGSLDFIGIYGVQWGNGIGSPPNVSSINNLPAGSFYLDISTSNIYFKNNSLVWELKGMLGSGGGGSSVTVVDNLISNSAVDALSAGQGKVLKDTIDALPAPITVVNSLASNSTTSALSAAQGLALNTQKAPLASPALIGSPTAPTTTLADSGTRIATVDTVLAGVASSNSTTTAALTTKADLVGGLVPAGQLPSYVDDVLEFANLAAFPATGETGKIYIAIDTSLTYRWTGSTYGALDPSLALGETSQTAYRGDRGKTAYDHSQVVTGNPHGSTTSDISEGTNLYFTAVRAVAAVLTGYVVAATNAVVAATDSISVAIGKLQKQISDNTTAIAGAATVANDRYTFNDQTGTSYTLVAADVTSNGRVVVTCSNAAAIAVALSTPTALGVTVGDSVNIRQGGAGAITIASSGGTILGATTTTAQYETFTLIAKTTTSWMRVGG